MDWEVSLAYAPHIHTKGIILASYSNSGFSRHLSQKYPDCSVHGIDLTPDYIDVCEKLTMMTGIKNTTFELGSASALPGPDSHYDIACMLHVGMNIKDKSNIFQQLQRVLKEGGTFAIYDVMKSTGSKDQPLTYPVPWANDESQSFVEDSETYIQAANAHGFRLISNLPRKEFAVKFFAPLLERLKNNRKMPAFSLAILFGEEYAEKKMYNLIDMILSDVVVPVELIFKKE